MVPIDMRGIGQGYYDAMRILKTLGPKGVAEAFLRAKMYFDANHDGEPERMRPQPMTAAVWRSMDDLGSSDDD